MIHNIPTKSILSVVSNRLEENDYIIIEDSNERFRYINGKLEPENKGGLSLYDINASIVSGFAPMTEEQLDNAVEVLDNFFKSGEYWMMLNYQCRYFTLFHKDKNAEETLGRAIIDCAANLGDILSISYAEGCEIWIKTENRETPHCFVVFNYDKGVIHCG